MNNLSINASSKKDSGRKPDLVCIGAQKAGTSWLFEVLSERPDIWAPPLKELHFFDSKFIEECRNWTGWHIRKEVKSAKEKHLNHNASPNTEYIRYLDEILEPPMFNGNWYKKIYSRAPSGSCCLDITPEYSCLPEEGVKFVANFLNKAKFIYIVRNPFDRAISQLQMNISRKGVPTTKEEWEICARLPVIHTRADYKTYIPRWKHHFGEDRMLFLPFKKIANNPSELLEEIESFTQLKPFRHYKKSKMVIHRTKYTAIPDYIKQFLFEKTREQDIFLQEHFGVKFHSEI